MILTTWHTDAAPADYTVIALVSQCYHPQSLSARPSVLQENQERPIRTVSKTSSVCGCVG